MRLRELVRWHGWRRGIGLWLRTRYMPMSRHANWMPRLWAECECKPEDLSPEFWQATKPHRADFEKLGFVQCHLTQATKKSDKISDPSIRDSGGIFFLDSTQCYFGQVLYVRTFAGSQRGETNSIRISFSAAFKHGNLTCTNQSPTFDSANTGKVIRINSYDVPVIYNRFREELQRCSETPRSFPDLDSLRQWSDALKLKAFEDRVRRGLFVRMTEPEAAAAWAERQRYPAGPPPPLPRRRFRVDVLPTALVLILLVSLIFYQHRQISGNVGGNKIAANTIDYQGQQFKMSRAYTDYEDYKDDPNNLDTNELGRIEKTMETVKVPPSFGDRKEFIHFMIFDFEFPGYGLGFLGASSTTDDGSTIETAMVEIPQRNKERVISLRKVAGGDLKLIDDFVYSGSDTNDISRVRFEQQQLEYFDHRGRLVREKVI
jgi:hypothetical protein